MTGAVLLALVPVAALIGLGWVLRRSGFLADAFWPQAERLAYYVLLPSLFVHGLATARLDAVPVASLAAALVLSTLAVAALLVAAEPWLRLDGAAFTSVFQGGVRFNSYVGVTLAAGLFGAQGVALAAACVAAIVPTVNVLCVLVFARYGAARPTLAGVARAVALNPLVLGCLIGGLLQAVGVGLPIAAEPVLRALGQASLPLGLLCVGAALELGHRRRRSPSGTPFGVPAPLGKARALPEGTDRSAIVMSAKADRARGWLRPLLAASVAKFALMPIAAALACAGLGLHGPAATAALLFQSLPTASSSYILARQLGGDAPLMAGITAVQTVLAAVAIPLVLAALPASPG